MPIYCLNSTKYARKRSRNILYELIGANNYYIGPMSHSQQLSMASYHILMGKQCKSASSSSLMVAINRFKDAVSNMKQTVLVPTMLDLVSYREEDETDSACSSEHCSDSGDRPKSACFHCLDSTDVSLCASQQSISMTDDSAISMSTSLSHHNLYEQYKLLDIIDKILSSDIALVSTQRQYCNLPMLLLDSDDNNNSNNGRNGNCCPKGLHEENGRVSEIHNGDNADLPARKLTNGRTLSIVGKTRRDSSPPTDGTSNGHTELVNGNGQEEGCPTGNLVVDCSLLKIKEKLEFHLISLKNILCLLSNTADGVTQKYLEDIQCEDRFEKQVKSCDSGESIRHYYTSN